METIKINEIEKKFTKPDEEGQCTPFWAVILGDGRKATVWDNQIADYIEKDVGIGGECQAEIKTTKSGYLNIRMVDMKSAVKGEVEEVYIKDIRPNPAGMGITQAKAKGDVIGAMCLTKIEFRNAAAPKPTEILESYRFYLSEL